MLKAIEPSEIAIIGYGCRLPGADGPDAFWKVLEEGRTTVTEVQPDRWPQARWRGARAGRSYVFAAGQLDAPWDFDPGFFGISPREAEQIDPQQRLVLQVAWEALEHARRPPSSLSKERTGVFMGASSSDHANRFYADPAAIDAGFMTGNTLSLIANRVSYALDLHGPSWTVDTACSSGLYALRAAATELASGRIDTALVGAVNMLLSPWPFVGFSAASMLSPSGRCAAFDASGDGYVRSEGAVVFVLRSLEAAIADGDAILGVVSGIGVNCDGRTAGISLPSGARQEALLREVYGALGLSPDRLAFVEAHGTGTRAGDPQETGALGAALGRARAAPLPIGSAKTNFGHLEAGAGLVGLLKAQMALERGVLPRSLHFETPNPDIDFAGLNLTVAREAAALPPGRAPWFAGVNAFGFGGANAHAVLRQPSAQERQSRAPRPAPAPLILSARSEDSLRALAGAMQGRLAGADADQGARLANALAYGRERMAHRLVVPACDPGAQAAALEGWLAGRPNVVAQGRAPARDGKVLFMFSGNGAQYVGMGRAALRTDPDFRDDVAQVAALFAPLSGIDLIEALDAPDLEDRLGATSLAQPLLFAIQVGVTLGLARRGVTPDATLGHSVGEVAAAWAAGAFDLHSAVRLIHARSRAQERLRGLGTMAAVLAGPDAARAVMEEAGIDGLSIAAENSARSVTLSGPAEMIEAFAAAARKRRIAVKRLGLEYPFHSAAADALEGELAGALAFLRPDETAIPYVSATLGRVADGQELGPRYWWANIRRAVLFRQGMEAALDLGCAVALEVGPRPVLGGHARDAGQARSAPLGVLASLQGGEDGDLGAAAARALAAGARIAPARFFGPDVRVAVDLPRYPWRNRPYRAAPSVEGETAFDAAPANPLLGWRAREQGRDWRAALGAEAPAWLADHRVGGEAVLPAAAFADMALSAAAITLAEDAGLPAGAARATEVLDLDILRPLALPRGEMAETRLRIGGDRSLIEIASRRRLSSDPFALHVRARARALVGPAPAPRPAPAGGAVMPAEQIYALAARMGLDYGPAFRRVVEVCAIDARAAWVALAPGGPAGPAACDHALDPTALDAALHGLLALLGARDVGGAPRAWLPVRIGSLALHRPGAAVAGAWVEVERLSPRAASARVTLTDARGEVIAALSDLRLRALDLGRGVGLEGAFHRQILVPLAPAAPDLAPVLASALALALAAPLRASGGDDAGALLLAAAARRAGWEAALAIAGPGGALGADALIASGRLAASARPLWGRIVAALAQDGAATEMHLGAAAAPPLGALTEALVAEAPMRVAPLMQVMALAGDLPAALRGGLAEAPAPGIADLRAAACDPAAIARWAALEAVFDACAVAAAGARLDVLALGVAPGALIAKAAACGVRLTLSDPDPRRVRALAADAAALPPGVRVAAFADLAARSFDLALSGDALHRHPVDDLHALRRVLRPGGALVAAEAAPSLLEDLSEGRRAEWWFGLTPDFAFGPRRDGAGWARALEEGGFASVDPAPFAAGEGAVVRALAPAAGAARSTARSTARSVAHSVAGDLAPLHLIAGDPACAAALRAAGREVIETAEGAETPPGAELVLLAPAPMPQDALDAALARIEAARLALAASPARLWIVLRGGAVVGPERALRPTEAALWGFARVAANERPEIEIRIIDIALDIPEAQAPARLAAELAAPGLEREIVLSAAGRAAVRAECAADPRPRAAAAQIAGRGEDATLRLDLARPGQIDSLRWSPAVRRAPQGDEVEIAVAAAGLNFRDLMWAQGLLPEEALEDGFAGPTLGMECAGTVLRAGPDARHAPGDRVMAFAPACFAGHVTAPGRAVVALPAGMDLVAGATAPVAFLTAWHGLVGLAALGAGETVLIHGGAGGVGLAALQVALSVGANVIATAGTPARRALLRHLGAREVFDSRSLRFADQVTAAGGVDVVLNSLSGEAMERSLACLRPFGRFVELGKRDFYDGAALGLRPFRRNLSYFGFDADQLLTGRPDLAARAFGAIAEGFARGDLIAPPHIVIAPEEVAEGFRLMQRSGHVGKIVVRPPAAPPAAPPVMRAPRGACLVVGGLGGFGVRAALRMARRGTPALWLTSRAGAPDAAARAAIAAIEALGAEVHVRAVDAADPIAMAALLGEIARARHPLRGVIHAAMALDDGLIAAQTPARMAAVMRPKIAGLALLDRATRGMPLDLFVAFSSATGLVGNPGQGAYVAANCWMEALCAERRRAGLPGLAMAFGAIADAGYLTRDAASRALLTERLGGAAITADDALDALEAAMAAPEPGVGASICARIDWAAAGRELALTATPLFARIEIPAGAEARGGTAQIRARLAGMAPEAVRAEVLALLAIEACRILRLPPEEIDPAQPLADMGFDSLMAIDLRMAAEEALGVDIPLMSIAGGATLADVAGRAAVRIAAPPEPEEEALAAPERQLADTHGVAQADAALLREASRRANGAGRALGRGAHVMGDPR